MVTRLFNFYFSMSDNLSLCSAIDIAMSALKISDDFSDPTSVASFMIFMSHITTHPKQVVQCNDLENLGIVTSSIMTTDFIQQYPCYNGISQGEVLSAVGFYAYMKQLKLGAFLDIHYPAFVLLLHHSRKFLINMYERMWIDDYFFYLKIMFLI